MFTTPPFIYIEHTAPKEQKAAYGRKKSPAYAGKKQ